VPPHVPSGGAGPQFRTYDQFQGEAKLEYVIIQLQEHSPHHKAPTAGKQHQEGVTALVSWGGSYLFDVILLLGTITYNALKKMTGTASNCLHSVGLRNRPP
jgi:hypothetical protein